MSVVLSPVGGVAAQFFTNSGAVLTGGKIYTYAAGTSTPEPTYTTASGTIAHTNPIVLDAAGRVPDSGEIWLTDGVAYKFVLKTSTDVLIATYDNISGINSNFVNFTNDQEIQTATAGQTVFTLTTMAYLPGTNSLSVFVDGVNQYGPGASYAYEETNNTTVTFNSGLHVGAEVKFSTTQLQGAGAIDASQVSYDPPFTGSVATNVEAKLAQTVSVKDFGAVGDGVTDDTAAIQTAIDEISNGGLVYFPEGHYIISDELLILNKSVSIKGVPGHYFADSDLIQGSFIQQTVNGKNGFTISRTDNTTTENFQVYIDGIALYGPGPNSGQTGSGIHATTGNTNTNLGLYLRFNNVGIRRFNEYGIYLRGAIYNNEFNTVGISYCGLNGIHITRLNGLTVVDGIVGETLLSNVSIFSCGQTGSSNDERSGLYCVPLSLGQFTFVRFSSSNNIGSGAILDGCTFEMIGPQFESNGASVPIVLLGDLTPNQVCAIRGGVFYYANAATSNAVKAVNVKALILENLQFHDTTTDYDIRLESTVNGAKVFNPWRVASGGTSAGLLSNASANLFYSSYNTNYLPAVQSVDVTEPFFTVKRTASGSPTWYCHNDNSNYNFYSTDTSQNELVVHSTGGLSVNSQNSKILAGVGTPEGAVTATVGSIYMRSNGGAGTTFYVKESGTGNTGWVAK